MFGFIQNALKRWNEKFRIEIDQLPPEGLDKLPTKLWPFMWFFIRQIKGLLLFIMGMELLAAISSSVVFWYVGNLVKHQQYSEALLLGGVTLVILRQQLLLG